MKYLFDYLPPEMEVIEIAVEDGFSASSGFEDPVVDDTLDW